MTKVALVKGNDRKQNIIKALEYIRKEIEEGSKWKQIVIKPNFVSVHIQLAASHVDQMRAILDFLQPIYDRRIIIAESAAGDTFTGFKNFGYFDLEKEYNVELRDLNYDGLKTVVVDNGITPPIKVRVAKTLLDPNSYVISAAKLKTHDAVVATMSIKNLLMGSMVRSDKGKMHSIGPKEMNLNLLSLAKKLWPDLAVIDGFIGMEGNGPSAGIPVDTKTAIASTDALAADRVALEVMGIPFEDIGYLNHCYNAGLGEADLNKIEILGNKIKECKKKFKFHETIKEQLKWKY